MAEEKEVLLEVKDLNVTYGSGARPLPPYRTPISRSTRARPLVWWANPVPA